MPGRAIDGEFIRNVEKGQEKPKCCSFHCIKTCDYQKSPYCIIKALYNAAKGNMKEDMHLQVVMLFSLKNTQRKKK